MRSIEEIKDMVERLDYIYLDQHMHRNYRFVVIEDHDGYKYDTDLFHLLEGKTPAFVGKTNPFTLYNISVWLRNNNLNYLLLDGNKYTHANDCLKLQCLDCGECFEMAWCNLSAGHRCGFCTNRHAGKQNNLAIRRPDLLAEWSNKNDCSPYDVSEYSNKYAWWICSSDPTHEWRARIGSRTTDGNGCPFCKISRGEKRVEKWLVSNNISYVYQARFDGCKNKKVLPFDFYLSDFNLCVEYHGAQHYQIVNNEFFGGERELEYRKNMDRIKEEFCNTNNIDLLVIPYWEFENIEQILEEVVGK